MPSPIRTTLATILPLVAARLTGVTGVPDHRVLLVARDQVPKWQGDSDLLVRCGPPRPDPDFSPAAGRSYLGVLRTLQVTARCRSLRDQADRSDTALMSSDGLFALEESVLDALQTFMPQSGDNWLLLEPVHWLPSAAPVLDTPAGQGWTHSDLMFSLRYMISTSYTGF